MLTTVGSTRTWRKNTWGGREYGDGRVSFRGVSAKTAVNTVTIHDHFAWLYTVYTVVNGQDRHALMFMIFPLF